ncbi:hypothetical protein BaRGS_00035734 [Batillaria attramentaria]|uniref:Uncharacterized protein n=1 Tax=Batillaria attramentaria TaxID=370345 RepID=A0ABD0JDN2_9CAEN
MSCQESVIQKENPMKIPDFEEMRNYNIVILLSDDSGAVLDGLVTAFRQTSTRKHSRHPELLLIGKAVGVGGNDDVYLHNGSLISGYIDGLL